MVRRLRQFLEAWRRIEAEMMTRRRGRKPDLARVRAIAAIFYKAQCLAQAVPDRLARNRRGRRLIRRQAAAWRNGQLRALLGVGKQGKLEDVKKSATRTIALYLERMAKTADELAVDPTSESLPFVQVAAFCRRLLSGSWVVMKRAARQVTPQTPPSTPAAPTVQEPPQSKGRKRRKVGRRHIVAAIGLGFILAHLEEASAEADSTEASDAP